jgi:TonB family protein
MNTTKTSLILLCVATFCLLISTMLTSCASAYQQLPPRDFRTLQLFGADPKEYNIDIKHEAADGSKVTHQALQDSNNLFVNLPVETNPRIHIRYKGKMAITAWQNLATIFTNLNDSAWHTIPPEMLKQDTLEAIARYKKTLFDIRGTAIPDVEKELLPKLSIPKADSLGVGDRPPYVDTRELSKRVIYPLSARTQMQEGAVTIYVLIDSTGKCVRGFVIASDNEVFNESGIYAVQNTPFIPARAKDKPIACWVSIPLVYHLR